MNALKKLSASLLAALLAQLPVQPVLAAASRSAPAGVPVLLSAPASPQSGVSLPSPPPAAAGGASAPAPAAGLLPAAPVPGPAAAAPSEAPAAPAAPAARASLAGLGAEAAPAASLPAAQASARLERHYSGASDLPSSLPVAAAAPPSAPSGLSPAAPARGSVRPAPSAPRSPRGRRSQRGAVNVKLLAIIGGAVVVVGVVVALVVGGINRGNAKDKLWADSQAREAVVAVEKARASKDGDALRGLAAQARGRESSLHDRVHEARSRKAETLPDGTKTDDAAALEAFEGLAGMRAETGADAVTEDPSRRLSGERPQAWEARLARSKEAARSGDWRDLALDLRALRAEMSAEMAASGRFASDLKDFDAQVPSLGGKLLKEQSSRGHADLKEFDAERAAEARLLERAEEVLRAAVADQLARDDASFRQSLLRRDRLASIASGDLGALVSAADRVDQGLQDMAAHRRSQAENLKLASERTRDPVLDANGNPVLDKDGNLVTQDNSGPYRDAAEKDAQKARDAAMTTAARIEEFDRLARRLRSDKDLQAEDLASSIPASAGAAHMDVHGYRKDLLDPADLRWHAGAFSESEAQDARARFGTARGKVQAVEGAVKDRLGKERAAIEARVAREIDSVR